MDPPATYQNPNDLHCSHYFEEIPLLPWNDQTMELDHYLEMVDHDQNYMNSDQLGIQDFDPFGDLSFWDWSDDITDVKPIDHHDCKMTSDEPIDHHVCKMTSDEPIDHHVCKMTSDEPNFSSASIADHGGRKRRRWDDDDGFPFLSCDDVNRIEHDEWHVTSDHEGNSVTAADDGGGKLWDDSLALLSCNDEDTSGDLIIKPIDHEFHNYVTNEATAVDGGRRSRAGRRSVPALELEEIEKLFEMPIVMAAKELNVGLTVLKKRCRELNIKRWPHRKLKSLKSLIQNVKEMGLKEEMEMLEENKRMMEKVPEMELTQRTKKLRQACFKFNYKNRRLLIPNLQSPHYPYPF